MKLAIRTAAIIALALTGAACASAPADDAQLAENGEEMECRRVAETGSRLGKKTCFTKQEWAEREANDAEIARESSRRMNERRRDMTSDIGM